MMHKIFRQSFIKLQIWAYSKGIFQKRKLFLPTFLCIGAIKGGTTWLYENLRHHPKIFLPETKETYFFSFRYGAYPISWYSDLFKLGIAKERGDITPGYSVISRKRIRIIRDLIPDAKLIFLMRNPIERAWSDAYMVLVSKEKRNFEEVSDQEFISYLTSIDCRLRGDYDATIKNYLSFFPKTQLLTIFLDDIELAPQATLSRILNFIGVDDPEDWGSFPLNDRIIPIYEENKQVYKGKIIEANNYSAEKIPAKYRELLEKIYFNEIKKLHDLYNAPIHRWTR